MAFHRDLKSLCSAALALTAVAVWSTSLSAALIVNDTWQDTDRNDPASPVHAENNGVIGTDADADTDLESAWYRAGNGTMSVVAPGGGAAVNGSPNILRTTLDAGSGSSASWTTFITPEASPVTLGAAGDNVTYTWKFTPTGVVATPSTSQGFRIALVDSPSDSRLAADGTPADGAFTGYALFLNFVTTTTRANPLQLLERNVASGNLLSSGGNWAGRADGAGFGNGAVGFRDGYEYTMVTSLTRNALGELEISSTISGGADADAINGTGSVNVSFTDSTPNTFTFDTFALRSGGAASSATMFDTSLFQVDVTVVPEPSTVALLGLCGLALAGLRRRGR